MLGSPDLRAQVEALGRSGYATDPNYASKVRQIAFGLDPLREGDLPAERAQNVERLAPLGEAAGRKAGEYSGVRLRRLAWATWRAEYLPKGIPTSEKFWVPALGFLGSMLASKSPTLGQAIGEGLVGGVSAYTGIERERSEIDKRLAEAEKIRNEAQTIEAALYERKWVLGKGWVVVDKRKPYDPGLQITDAKP